MSTLSFLRNTSIINTVRTLIPDNLVNNTLHLTRAILANRKYHFPSQELTIIGVTGTDGKTTTATMLHHILNNAGYKVALITTVAAKIGDQELDTGFHVTTPDPEPLQKMLRTIVDKGFTHVVLETTSHGFAQNRLWGVHFTGGIITNITEDHLDYHKTWEEYAKAKAQLFRHTHFAILNQDDQWFDFIKTRAHGDIITYGRKKGKWNLKNFNVKVNMIGSYNRLNALAAAAAAFQLGVPEKDSLNYLKSFAGVLGRMQIMHNGKYLIVVDFAHTPNALKESLTTLRKDALTNPQGRIISVFGCAGIRDKNRRKMGFESAQKADITIITAEDPRTEGVEKISDDISSWAIKGGAIEISQEKLTDLGTLKYPVFTRIPDRQEAIDTAINIAQPGDVIGIFGKGHEQSMCYGSEETPWTDQTAVKKALKKLANA